MSARERNKRYRDKHKDKCRAYAEQYRAARRKPVLEMDHVTHKRCRGCLALKPLSAFSKDNRRRRVRSARGGLGVAASCRECCARAYNPNTAARKALTERLAANGFKRCGSCETAKPIAEFSVRKASNDGLSYTCRDCTKARCKAWQQQHPNAFREWSVENRDSRAAQTAEWRSKNLQRLKDLYKRWAKENPGRVSALAAKRHAAKLNATPPWSDHDAIRAFYERAAVMTASTGVRHDVDHIVPLQGRHVCGLHVPHNLQVLTHAQNLSKGNRFTSHWLRPPSPSFSEPAQIEAA